DAGRKEAQFTFNLVRDVTEVVKGGDGKEVTRTVRKAVASSNPVTYLFESAPAVVVKLHVLDDDGQPRRDGRPVMGALTFRDNRARVYPSQSRRLAPDFGFHPQVYRADGETVSLQPGKYTVTYTRGPEYLMLQKEITIPATPTYEETFQLKRWT